MFWHLTAQAEQPSQTLQWVDKIARTPISVVVYFLLICTVFRIASYLYMKNIPTHKRVGMYTFAKVLNELLDAVIYAGMLVFLIIRPFVVQTFHVPSGSMLNTLKEGDFLLASKFKYRYSDPQVNDIVIFRPPKIGLLDPTVTDMDYIKRCIGVPGDVIEIKDGSLYRNGKKADEPFLKEPYIKFDFKLVNDNGEYIPVQYTGDLVNFYPRATTAPAFVATTPQRMLYLKRLPAAAVPAGHYIMMGDNRNGSYDSRAWGLVKRDSIIAKSEFIWMPLSRIGITR